MSVFKLGQFSKDTSTNCATNQYLHAGKCTMCPEKYYCDGVIKTKCASNEYCPLGTGPSSEADILSGPQQCTNLQTVSYTAVTGGLGKGCQVCNGTPTLNGGCAPCAVGTKWDASAGGCVGCGSNTYQDETGQASCKVCPSNSLSKDVTKDGCKCKAGFGVSINDIVSLTSPTPSCTQCGMHEYLMTPETGTAQCTACPPGMTQSSPMNSSDINSCKCPANKYRTAQAHPTIPYICTSCTLGQAAPKGSTDAAVCGYETCGLNEYLVKSNTAIAGGVCTTCYDHSTSNGGSVEKCVCSAGYTEEKSANGNSCVQCPLNTYKASKGNEQCTPCTDGQIALRGLKSCSKCVDRKIRKPADDTPATASTIDDLCMKCPDGKYYDTEGKYPKCSDPGNGYYVPKSSDTRMPCELGTARTTTQPPDTCVECPVSHYAPKAAMATCTRCPAYEYNTINGSKTQNDCKPEHCLSAYFGANGGSGGGGTYSYVYLRQCNNELASGVAPTEAQCFGYSCQHTSQRTKAHFKIQEPVRKWEQSWIKSSGGNGSDPNINEDDTKPWKGGKRSTSMFQTQYGSRWLTFINADNYGIFTQNDKTKNIFHQFLPLPRKPQTKKPNSACSYAVPAGQECNDTTNGAELGTWTNGVEIANEQWGRGRSIVRAQSTDLGALTSHYSLGHSANDGWWYWYKVWVSLGSRPRALHWNVEEETLFNQDSWGQQGDETRGAIVLCRHSAVAGDKGKCAVEDPKHGNGYYAVQAVDPYDEEEYCGTPSACNPAMGLDSSVYGLSTEEWMTVENEKIP